MKPKIINLFEPKQPNEDDKKLTSYLLTRSVFLNSLAATAAYELKEHTKEKDKGIYNHMRALLANSIKRSEELHAKYMTILPKDEMFFWQKLDELNKLIDENLLSK